jgi:hypothetical protein
MATKKNVAETALALVLDVKDLNKLVTLVINQGRTYRNNLHIAWVSCVVHAAVHGINDREHPINRLYDDGMSTNDRSAARNYIRRVHAAIGGIDWSEYSDENPVPAEILKSAAEAGQFLGYSEKRGFFVHKDKSDIREKFVKSELPELMLKAEEGSGWIRFFDRNNMAELNVYGASNVLKDIQAVVTKASEDTERRETHVHKAIVAELKASEERIAALVEKYKDWKPEETSVGDRAGSQEGVSLQ